MWSLKDKPLAFSIIMYPNNSITEEKRSLLKKNLKKKRYYRQILVNCEGKRGLFRLKHLNPDLKEVRLVETIENKLLKSAKSLNGGMPKKIEGLKIDYCQYLTYKIEDGKVSEVLP